MKKQSVIEKIRQWIAGIGWKLFLWGNRKTAEQYWKEVVEQEQIHKQEMINK